MYGNYNNSPPKKYVKINGVMKLNPEYKRWKEQQSGGAQPATTVQHNNALPIVSNMDDYMAINDASQEAGGGEIQLSEATNATIEMMQEPEISLEAGMQPDETVDELGHIMNKYEIPMGLMNKLMMLSEFESLEFIIDDSGSMAQNSDTVDIRTNRPQTRWQEAHQRLKQMTEVLSYIPFTQMNIIFLNRSDEVVLTRNGRNPQAFLSDAYSRIDGVFARGPSGSTPAKEKLTMSMQRGQGKSIARYFFGDGTPNGGVAAQQAITQMLSSRSNPEGNPITFLSCTNDDEQVEWMKTTEEIVPFCSESDDFKDEAREVLKDQGSALPYSKGFHLICQLVAAMNPHDLDCMDESVPFSKATLDNILGIQSDEASYRHYFNCFLEAQRNRRVDEPIDQIKKNQNWESLYPELLRAPNAKDIPAVQAFKQQLKSASSGSGATVATMTATTYNNYYNTSAAPTTTTTYQTQQQQQTQQGATPYNNYYNATAAVVGSGVAAAAVTTTATTTAYNNNYNPSTSVQPPSSAGPSYQTKQQQAAATPYNNYYNATPTSAPRPVQASAYAVPVATGSVTGAAVVASPTIGGASASQKLSSSGKIYHFLGNNSSQVDAQEAERKAREKYPLLFHKNERVELAFTARGGAGRDKHFLTSARILFKDGKGIGSKRKNYKSIPYDSIQAFSVDTAGQFDGDVSLLLWTSGIDFAKVDFGRGACDIFAIQQFINSKINWTNQLGTQDYVHGVPVSISHAQDSISSIINWISNDAAQQDPATVDTKLKNEFPVLMQNENVVLAFKCGRDYTVFTNNRLLLMDVQGFFGKKISFLSFTWRTVQGFSVRTGSFLDFDTEMYVFTNIRQFRVITQDFRKSSADIFAIQKHMSNRVLGPDMSPNPGMNPMAGSTFGIPSWFSDNQRPLDVIEVNSLYHRNPPILQSSEQVEMAFRGRRDVTMFTTKRLLIVDIQGFSGKKVEYKSFPWNSILAFGVRTAGKYMDQDCEMTVWTEVQFDPPESNDDPPTPGNSMIELDFNKHSVDLLCIKRYLSLRLLEGSPDVPVDSAFFMAQFPEGGITQFLSWISNNQYAVNPQEIDRQLHTTNPILLNNERVVMAFRAGRDMSIFTSYRLIIMDVQGFSGKKVEFNSIPYRSIRTFSAESAGGTWDRDSQLKIYTRNLWNMTALALDFRKNKADIMAINKFLSSIIMGSPEEAARALNTPYVESPSYAGFSSFVSFLTDNAKEINAQALEQRLHTDPPLLLSKERIRRAFKQGRDTYAYTTHRLLIIDVQGFSGKRVEYKSIPLLWVHGYEIETAGHLDNDAEVYIHSDVPSFDRTGLSIRVKHSNILEMNAYLTDTLLFGGDGTSQNNGIQQQQQYGMHPQQHPAIAY